MTGREWIEVEGVRTEIAVPVSGGENVVIPVVRAIVRDHANRSEGRVLIQRRDVDGESVRGRREIPGGRWQAGESPDETAIREVEEETGVAVSFVEGIRTDRTGASGERVVVHPFVVVAGVRGGFPAAHLILTAVGSGDPRPAAGETVDCRWVDVATLRDELADVDDWVPSSRQALLAYVETVFSGSGM